MGPRQGPKMTWELSGRERVRDLATPMSSSVAPPASKDELHSIFILNLIWYYCALTTNSRVAHSRFCCPEIYFIR